MDILYKNNETKFENLSGGEQARVVIAFNLALCDMFDSKLIMLDEVTANLDADLTETILESVKQHMPRKIVVVVAHQCVCGIFDQVIPRPV
jgi:ABC-type lipoprotein export system ATPase subunit